MSGDWQTERRPSQHVLTIAAALALLGAIGGAVVLLERGRSRDLIAEEVKLWRSEDGSIRGVQFVTNQVMKEHWALLEGAEEPLQSVNLSNTQQVAGGLQRLNDFPNLRDLYLADCSWVDDAQVARIAKAHRLHTLDISGTPLTDKGLRQFDLSEFTNLTADRCRGLTDETFEMLIALDSVRTISMKGVQISSDQFERWRFERPDMAILTDPPQLSWEQIRRYDVISTQIDWLTGETDVDQFVRYRRLPHDWASGRFDENARARHLNLGGPGVARSLPKILAAMTEIESLTLADTRLDGGLQHLSPKATSVRLIELHADSRLDGLETITWLSSIIVRGAEFTPEQWAVLFDTIAANESLRGLTLSGALVPPGAFTRLRNHRELRLLWLIDTQITEANLQAIGQISSLEVLDTANIPISEVVVESWLQLPKLKYISVYQGGIGPELAERLRQKYPDAQVHIN